MAGPAKAGDERGATDDGRAPAVASLGEQQLPVPTLKEAIPHLRRPFTPQAIKFKVQSVLGDNKGALIIAYIDARLAIERLNAVVAHNWSARYEPIAQTKLAWCYLTVDGVTRADVGESTKGMSKDLVSDALKRAAVPFGVGVSIYALPQITIWMNDGEKRLENRRSNKGSTLAITEHGHVKLREGYAKWLAEHGEKLFGPALDHGDVEGATLTEPDQEAEAPAAPKPEPLNDPRAKQLLADARTRYQAIIAQDPGKVALKDFERWVAHASTSHDELERLVKHLDGIREEVEAK